ncbi:MAG TPA: hypothetical protein VIG99_09150 [Myxococcaceae bacterium]
MTRPTLIAALLLGTLSCARTALEPDCPQGMTLQGAGCVCLTDQGCPHGYICQKGDADAGEVAGGICVCQATSCCPTGYAFSEESGTCVCASTACCPADHRWDEASSRCACDNQACCPDGYTFDPSAGACRCAADQCCPAGFIYDPDPARQTCVCNADSCCPLDHKFDSTTHTCVCARDSCCPLGYKYDNTISACVCSGNACCPVGFRYDLGTNRCVCTTDASCGTAGVHNRCDPVSGTCRCRDDLGCTPPPGGTPQYCNALGFCQSLSCTSDRDCPVSAVNPTFCDITTGTCIPIVACTLDDHCPFGQICTANRCQSGCRTDNGCPLRQACLNGQCQNFCRDNQLCSQSNQFCNTSSGVCSAQPGRVDCANCGSNPFACGNDPDAATCLVFIAEGQQQSFCGMACEENEDCPSGFDCDGVIFGCGSEGSACQSDNGQTVTCKSFNVENEGIQLYCADPPTGQPHEYFRRCGPSSGFCPASVSP